MCNIEHEWILNYEYYQYYVIGAIPLTRITFLCNET